MEFLSEAGKLQLLVKFDGFFYFKRKIDRFSLALFRKTPKAGRLHWLVLVLPGCWPLPAGMH
jgi:hypothetical protein